MVQFRVKALNQLNKPDDLDLLAKVTKLRGWVAVLTIGVVVVGAILWSFYGELPAEATAKGLLSRPQGVSVVASTTTGQVTQVLVQGNNVREGAPIAEIEGDDGKKTVVRSRWAGAVTGTPIDVGDYVKPGDPLLFFERSDVLNDRLLAFLFVEPGDATSIAPGMKVDLDVSAAPSAAFGVLRGTVSKVERYPANIQELANLLSDEGLAKELTGNKPKTVVTVELRSDPATISGFRWSTKDGPPFPIDSGIQVQGTVIKGTQRPIDLVFGK